MFYICLNVVMHIQSIWKMCNCYGRHLINFNTSNILFYGTDNLNHCTVVNNHFDYYHFNTNDPISMTTDTRNSICSLCKIRKNSRNKGF